MNTPEQIVDIEDALVSDENPADEDTLDFQRCARLHNYLVAYAYMARFEWNWSTRLSRSDNDFEDKERFVVIYDTTLDLGSHCLGVLYDQLNHRASFPLTIEDSESIEPVAEHWDMWFPLETILTQWIHMLRMGEITVDLRNERDLSDEEANSRHQIGLWCWHPYCAAQIDSTVAAMDRYTDAVESRMQSLLPMQSSMRL
ncbi:unnamed protein product [Penicillium viridicatum]